MVTKKSHRANINNMITKKELRAEIRQKRNAMSDSDILSFSNTICNRVITYSGYTKAEVVFIYVPLRGEVDTMPIIYDALEKNKVVAVPRVSGKVMNFYQIKSTKDLQTGYMSILEPKDYCKMITSSNALIIMPGTAFDKKLHRCGYGGGFYDKYLDKYPKLDKIAVAFDFQIYDEIPYEDTDISPDMVFTEKRTLVNL